EPELAQARDLLAHLLVALELLDAERRAEQLGDRRARPPPPLTRAARDVHAHVVAAELDAPARLEEQARLAAPRVAGDADHLHLAAVGCREELADPAELLAPADELARRVGEAPLLLHDGGRVRALVEACGLEEPRERA